MVKQLTVASEFFRGEETRRKVLPRCYHVPVWLASISLIANATES